jgi:hypothetical protein
VVAGWGISVELVVSPSFDERLRAEGLGRLERCWNRALFAAWPALSRGARALAIGLGAWVLLAAGELVGLYDIGALRALGAAAAAVVVVAVGLCAIALLAVVLWRLILMAVGVVVIVVVIALLSALAHAL